MASHKALKGVVRSFVQSFTSTMNFWVGDYVMGHVVRAAWSTGATEFRVNLLSGEADSSPLLTPYVRGALDLYVKKLPDIVERSKSSLEFVTLAEMIVTVDPTQKRPYNRTLFESPYSCTVRIVDDRGKAYTYTDEGWWFPEKPPPEKKKSQWWKFW